MIQVQKVKWCIKQNSVNDLLFNTYLGQQCWISIRLLNQWQSHWRQLYFLLKLFNTLDVNFVQKCQICVICKNLTWLSCLGLRITLFHKLSIGVTLFVPSEFSCHMCQRAFVAATNGFHGKVLLRLAEGSNRCFCIPNASISLFHYFDKFVKAKTVMYLSVKIYLLAPFELHILP